MHVTPSPDRLLSLDEWADLAENNSRYFELQEGVLTVSPRPPARHQMATMRLSNLLHRRLPAELVLVQQVEIVIRPEWPSTVRVPDLIALPESIAASNPPRIAASDVRLAIEVITPGSDELDRVVKPFEYAQAGIPEYWILDLDPVELTAYRLRDGTYTPVTVDVAELLTRRA